MPELRTDSSVTLEGIGNFGDSACEGFPIFKLGGGAGYVWGARYDETGKGSLRMTAVDASQFYGCSQHDLSSASALAGGRRRYLGVC